ncbi:MAG: hypothetical protein PHQ66_03685 [Candidatus Nanoarchaeia archaeon]|nr:hypothetical protein [Candidatus Nanoarchaeia archaeon]MDD5357536.1 hypothetical protein [Candidatus Nanoarchaeia archaeon]MDD5588455.1 hypothetical protein [Candidatus Nanoarchaeia archaeon]
MELKDFIIRCGKEIEISNNTNLENFAKSGYNEEEMNCALGYFYEMFKNEINEKNFDSYKMIIANFVTFGKNTQFYRERYKSKY